MTQIINNCAFEYFTFIFTSIAAMTI